MPTSLQVDTELESDDDGGRRSIRKPASQVSMHDQPEVVMLARGSSPTATPRRERSGRGLGEYGDLLQQHLHDTDSMIERWARSQQDAFLRQEAQLKDLMVEQRQALMDILATTQSRPPGSDLGDLAGSSPQISERGAGDSDQDIQSPHQQLSSPTSFRGQARATMRRRTRMSTEVRNTPEMVRSDTGGQHDKKDVLKLYEAMLRDNNIMDRPAYQRFLSFIGLQEPLEKLLRAIGGLKLAPSSISKECNRICEATWFEMVVLALILLNCVFIALGASDNMRRVVDLYKATPVGVKPQTENLEITPAGLVIMDLVFAVMFSIEWLLRILGQQGQFFVGKDVQWNLLDTATLASNWMECYMNLVENESLWDLTWVRVLRVIRVLRSLRAGFLFKELQKVLLCLLGSMLPLLWAVVVLGAILYIFAVIILQGVSSALLDQARDARIDPRGTDLEESITSEDRYLTKIFFSFPRACLTLFMSVTGGEDWGVVQQQLENINYIYGALWVVYIMVMTFGVLNVITGIFVETAVARARADRDIAAADELEKNKSRLRQVLNLFANVDHNRDGIITFQEWEAFAQTDETRKCMTLLGLDARKTRELFELIDYDENKEVSLQEFAIGCMQLQGPPKSVDVETLMRHSKKMMRKVTELFHTVDERIEMCLDEQSSIHDRVLDMIDRMEYSAERVRDIRGASSDALFSPSQALDWSVPNKRGPPSVLDNVARPPPPKQPEVKETEKKSKGMSRQQLEKRVFNLAKLGEELIAVEMREEFRSAIGLIARDIQAQQSWSMKVARSISSEIDSLSIRYGIYHHEQQLLQQASAADGQTTFNT